MLAQMIFTTLAALFGTTWFNLYRYQGEDEGRWRSLATTMALYGFIVFTLYALTETS